MKLKSLFAFCLCCLAPVLAEQSEPFGSSDGGGSGGGGTADLPIAPLIEPVWRPIEESTRKSIKKPSKINWEGLAVQSAWFISIEHAFRYATEQGTREAKGPLVKGYLKSVGSLHGWSDGDPFYVNYVGHPMQGAAAGYIWAQNDRDYASAELGLNRHYWRGRLRATAFSWLYSTQFEIGPVSEASIGYIQSRHPQQGFVDHVVTPAIGLAWMVGEDAIDKWLLPGLEKRVQNKYVRILARGFLNPARSWANMLSGKVPYYREDRPINADYSSAPARYISPVPANSDELPPDEGPAPFELTASSMRRTFAGSVPGVCMGGGAEAAFRLAGDWQFIVDVNGCALGGLPTYTTGDTLSYLVGPRWTPSERRLRPYMQFLVGGMKVTKDKISPETKKALEAAAELTGRRVYHEEYSTKKSSHGFALAAGTGVDLNLGRAAALKLASLEYNRSWNKPIDGIDYNQGLQLKLGVTLRMGTW